MILPASGPSVQKGKPQLYGSPKTDGGLPMLSNTTLELTSFGDTVGLDLPDLKAEFDEDDLEQQLDMLVAEVAQFDLDLAG